MVICRWPKEGGKTKTPTQEHFYSCVGVLLAALFEGVTQKFSFFTKIPLLHRQKAVFFLDYLYLLFQFFRMVILQEKHIIHRIRQLLPLQKRRKLFLESLWKISGICGWKNNDNNTTVNQALCVRDNCLCFVWDSKGQRTYSVPFLLEAECAHQKYNCVKRL